MQDLYTEYYKNGETLKKAYENEDKNYVNELKNLILLRY